jgi:hypothetical protein
MNTNEKVCKLVQDILHYKKVAEEMLKNPDEALNAILAIERLDEMLEAT